MGKSHGAVRAERPAVDDFYVVGFGQVILKWPPAYHGDEARILFDIRLEGDTRLGINTIKRAAQANKRLVHHRTIAGKGDFSVVVNLVGVEIDKRSEFLRTIAGDLLGRIQFAAQQLEVLHYRDLHPDRLENLTPRRRERGRKIRPSSRR